MQLADYEAAVANARVSKTSPTKKASVKKEQVDSSSSSFMEGFGFDSFDHDEPTFTGGDLFDGMEA